MRGVMLVLASLMWAGGVFAADAPNVVVSIKPIHALVAGVMHGVGEPALLVDGAQSPHDFQLKPEQMRALQHADVVFYVGDGYESFLRRALQGLPASVKKVPVSAAKDVTLLPLRSGGVWESHEHESEHEHEHDEHAENDHDMHVWLNPQHAVAITREIADVLSAVYPQQAALLQANATKQVTRLEQLDARLKAMLQPVQRQPFLVFHDAYQYFEQHYGLHGVGSVVFEPEDALTPQRVQQIREALRSSGAACAFTEPFVPEKTLATITEGLNVRTAPLDPEGVDAQPDGMLYDTLMLRMAERMVGCLQK